MSSLVSDRLARRIVVILLVLKMLISGFDMVEAGVRYSYDFRHHGWRARSAGLEMGKMAYNPPLYYAPALPSVSVGKYYDHHRPIIASNPNDESDHSLMLLERIRGFNIAYLLAFYVAWIYLIFPHVLPNRRAWFLASLFLLLLPGYQKVANMAHPDNLFMALSALATALWVRYERLHRERFRHGLLLGFVTALIGLTRPFAIVPVALLSLANAWGQLRDSLSAKARPLYLRLLAALGRVAIIGAMTASIAGSWWAFRYYETGALTDAYKDSYLEHFEPYKVGFDYRHYFTSFHFAALVQTPNRGMSGTDEPSHNQLGNTFPTILYSEIWGDHWLYFSGSVDTGDQKAWLKRIILVEALPLSIGFMGMLLVGLGRAGLRLAARRLSSKDAMMAAMTVLGFAIFVYWQGWPALLPGKNSTIKFLYIAWMAPYAIATAFGFRPRERTFHLLVATMLITFAVALPIAIVDASWLSGIRSLK